MAVTIKDVAEAANVSISAVSYAINNSGPVSEEKRKRIMQAVEELGYVQNGMARSLRMQKKGFIGYFANSLYGAFYGEVLKGIEEVFSKNGKELVAGKCNRLQNDLQVIRLLTEKMTDGAIIFSPKISDEMIMKLADKDFPVVVLDRELHGEYISSVLIDNVRSAYKVGEHIASVGLNSVGCLIGSGFDGEQRMRGFQNAVTDFDLEVSQEWTLDADWKEEIAYKKTLEMIQKGNVPQVIFAFNDEMAKGCMEALKDMDIRIPEDVSVIGLDDIVISKYLNPKLTTVHRPLYELGVMAAETLLEMQDGGKSKHIVLTTNLVERDSCIKKKNMGS